MKNKRKIARIRGWDLWDVAQTQASGFSGRRRRKPKSKEGRQKRGTGISNFFQRFLAWSLLEAKLNIIFLKIFLGGKHA